MNPEQRMVREFHDQYLKDSGDIPRLVSDRTLLLRGRLIVEEAGEFLAAASNRDLVEVADALVDILYVTYGAANVLGIDLQPLFCEVHRSNMSKRGRLDPAGKVTKGSQWSPPQIERLLMAQGWRPPADDAAEDA